MRNTVQSFKGGGGPGVNSSNKGRGASAKRRPSPSQIAAQERREILAEQLSAAGVESPYSSANLLYLQGIRDLNQSGQKQSFDELNALTNQIVSSSKPYGVNWNIQNYNQARGLASLLHSQGVKDINQLGVKSTLSTAKDEEGRPIQTPQYQLTYGGKTLGNLGQISEAGKYEASKDQYLSYDPSRPNLVKIGGSSFGSGSTNYVLGRDKEGKIIFAPEWKPDPTPKKEWWEDVLDNHWDLQLGATISGTSDIYTLAIRTLSGTQSAIGSLSFWDLTG